MLTQVAAPDGQDPDRDAGTALVRAAKAGDLPAFEQLMARHERQVYSVALRLLGNREDAQDAAQETFVRLYRHLARIEEAGALASWLYRVTVNVCRDMGRQRRPSAELADDHPGSGDAPDADLFREEQRRILRLGLRRLSERERTAVVLRDLEGLSIREVAGIFGSTEVTVRKHLSVARLKLRQFVEGMRRGRP